MEKADEVKLQLGSENVRLFLYEIQTGRLKEPKVKKIAFKMHERVHGEFVNRQHNKEKLDDTMRYMLDAWNDIELYKEEVNSFNRLIQILEDDEIEENALALKMKRNCLAGQASRPSEGDTTSSTAEEEQHRLVPSSFVATTGETAAGITTPIPARENGEQHSLLPSCSINIPVESAAPPSVSSKKRRPWKNILCIFVILLLFAVVVTVVTVLLKKESKTTGLIGLGGTNGKSVAWRKSCPGNKYTSSFSDLDTSVDNSNSAQMEDEIWFCGGDHDQTRSCRILSLIDGKWRPLEHKMNQPRFRPVMKVEGSKMIVQGGKTSDPNSLTGCMNTQEVFDKDNPTRGWVTEDMEETTSCLRTSKVVGWKDLLVEVEC